MHPAILVYCLGGLLGHVIVTLHCQKSSIAELATFPTRHHLASYRIDDLDIDIRQRFPNCRRFQLEWIFRQRRGYTATAFRLSKYDGNVGSDALFHLLHQGDGNGSSSTGDDDE